MGYVTPEAVVLQVRRAGPGSRILARGLDTVIQLLLLLAFALADGAVSGGSFATAGTIILFVAVPLIWLGYPAIMEAAWRGRTLGKAAFHLRVVTREGAPIRFWQAAVRSILYVVVDGFPFVGIPMLLITRDTVRLGDLAAGTMVVSEGSAAAMPTAVVFRVPPGCDEYVRSLDISGLGSAQYELVRQFLLRSATLTGPARWSIAVDVARPVAARMRHDVPAGMHPELFLQCVAAAFQLRSDAAVGGGVGGGGGVIGWGPAVESSSSPPVESPPPPPPPPVEWPPIESPPAEGGFAPPS